MATGAERQARYVEKRNRAIRELLDAIDTDIARLIQLTDGGLIYALSDKMAALRRLLR